MTEAEFTQKVLKFFRKKLESAGLRVIKVESNDYILRDFTFGKSEKRDTWELLAGTQEQDIIFYKDVVPREDFLNGLVRVTGTGLRKNLIIPLALCELKVGTMNTHGMMVAAKIAFDIKTLFPHCVSFFIISSNKERRLGSATVLRHGKGFDGVYLDWEREKERIWKDLLEHFKYLKQREVI